MEGDFILGTAIKITTFLNKDLVDSVNITIKDSSEAIVIDNASMSKVADGIYEYTYQSDEDSQIEGTYVARIYARIGNNISIKEKRFGMIEELPEQWNEY